MASALVTSLAKVVAATAMNTLKKTIITDAQLEFETIRNSDELRHT